MAIDWEEVCICGHDRGQHWFRVGGSDNCGEADCTCIKFSMTHVPSVDVERALYDALKNAVDILARHDSDLDCLASINCAELHEMREALALYESKGKL